MTKLRKLNLFGFIANEVQAKKIRMKSLLFPRFFFNHDVFASEEEQHFHDNTK